MKTRKPFSKAKPAADAIKRAAYARTEEALVKIEIAKKLIEEELCSGSLADRLLRADKYELEQADFMTYCGLSWNFLNGPKHKKTTKLDVQTFLTNVNRKLRDQLAGVPDVEQSGSPTVAHMQLQARYDRLKRERDELRDYLDRILTRTHEWHLERLQAMRMVRELKMAAGLSVVHLHRR